MEIFGFMKKLTKLISNINCQAITTVMMIDSLSLHLSHSLAVEQPLNTLIVWSLYK